LRVAFLGPAGTFTEEALRASVPAGVDEVPYPTVYETVMAVQEGEADRAVVPIENSLEGGVAATLDALAVEAEDVRISAEVVHPIHHCLVARTELPLDAIERVVSHPQATAQCARFLRDRLPRAERVTAASTAEAVRSARESDGPLAALGSRLSAELYDCTVLAENVEDHPDNLTRFVWLAREGEVEAPSPPAKTSVVFWGFNDESPGALVNVLSEFAAREINLTRIESRPRRVRLGHYMFFADLEGAVGEARVQDALEGLRKRVETLRVLGSYSAAS
jgi:prephenate dehydratase